MAILDPNRKYTFSDFFALNLPVDELLAEFGYGFARRRLHLAQHDQPLDRLEELRDRIEEVLPLVRLNSELARREILISRVVTEVLHYTQAQLKIEYPLKISQQLQGTLDYLLQSQSQVVIIEAKKEDLVNGVTQLAVELIAIDRWLSSSQRRILGAVTTGSLWQFVQLDREHQHIEEGLETYRVPDDLEPLLRILVAALS